MSIVTQSLWCGLRLGNYSDVETDTFLTSKLVDELTWATFVLIGALFFVLMFMAYVAEMDSMQCIMHMVPSKCAPR